MSIEQTNWRPGPIWLAVNFLLIESILRFYMFYGKTLEVECPTGSGDYMHLGMVAEEIQHRLQRLFVRDEEGRRATNNGDDALDFDPHWKDYLWFHEFFDADTGRGLGASHQCGWTGLIAKVIHDTGVTIGLPQTPKTPSAAVAHYSDSYFDETFTKSSKPRIRRSSTGRSIGNPSSIPASVNGDHNGDSVVTEEDDERSRRRSEANQHVAHYVTNQLERIRTDDSSAYETIFDLRRATRAQM